MTEILFQLRSERLDWREVDGEIIALDLKSAQYLAINRSAAELWPLLVEGATRAELVGRLREAFGADVVEAERDLDAFLAALEAQELLETE